MQAVATQNPEYLQTMVAVFHAPHERSSESPLVHERFVLAQPPQHDHGILLQTPHALLQQPHPAYDLLRYRDAHEYGDNLPLRNALLFQQRPTRRNAGTKIAQHTGQTAELRSHL